MNGEFDPEVRKVRSLRRDGVLRGEPRTTATSPLCGREREEPELDPDVLQVQQSQRGRL